jgi:hydrogenase maturation protease
VILVIGYGNPLRQDDGVGWHVAEQLDASPGADLEIRTSHQLTPEMAEPVSRSELVVFVDARETGIPGATSCTRVAQQAAPGAVSTHSTSPEELLALAHDLFGAAPDAWVVSVAGAAFDHGTTLSPAVRASVEPAARLVRGLVESSRRARV